MRSFYIRIHFDSKSKAAFDTALYFKTPDRLVDARLAPKFEYLLGIEGEEIICKRRTGGDQYTPVALEQTPLNIYAKRLQDVAKMLSLLPDSVFSDNSDFSALFLLENPDDLSVAIQLLKENDLLSYENLIAVAEHSHSTELTYAFLVLKSARITLSPDNQIILKTGSPNPCDAARSLAYLKSVKEPCDDFLARAILRHTKPWDLTYAIISAHKLKIMCPELLEVLTAIRYPREYIDTLKTCHAYRLPLTQEVGGLYTHQKDPQNWYKLTKILALLLQNGLLTPDNKSALLEHTEITYLFFVANLLSDNGNHRLTQHHFDLLCRPGLDEVFDILNNNTAPDIGKIPPQHRELVSTLFFKANERDIVRSLVYGGGNVDHCLMSLEMKRREAAAESSAPLMITMH